MQTVTRTNEDGVTVHELAPFPSPVPPSPPPPAPRSATVIDVPEGEPRAVALQMLGTLIGDEAAVSFRGRAARAMTDIEEQVEAARLRTDVKLEAFVEHVALKLRVRNELTARADVLQKRLGIQPLDLATEVCAYVRSVKRWEDGHAIRADRARLIGEATVELATVTTRLRTELPQSVRSHHGADPSEGHHARGLIASEDEWLRRYEAALVRRGELRRALERLGRGRAETGRAVSDAVKAVGRGRIVELIAPRMIVDTLDVKRLESDLGRLDGEIQATDPATALAKTLATRRASVAAELAQAQRAVLDAQAGAAGVAISAAAAGDLGSILTLEKLVGSVSAFAYELAQARGSDAELVATIDLLLTEAEGKAAAEVARRQALQYRPQDASFAYA